MNRYVVSALVFCSLISACSSDDSAPLCSAGVTESRERFKEGYVSKEGECRKEVQKRTCLNGVWGPWNGSFKESSCVVKTVCASGSVEERIRYKEPQVFTGRSCEKETQTRTCANKQWGLWTGTYTYEECEVGIRSYVTMPSGSKAAFLHLDEGKAIFSIDGKGVPSYLDKSNKAVQVSYSVEPIRFPNAEYGVERNAPFDYYHIWIGHQAIGGILPERPPQLDELVKTYSIIVLTLEPEQTLFKESSEAVDLKSDAPSVANAKAFYVALLDKMRDYPKTRFILWTPLALPKTRYLAEATNDATQAELLAKRAADFVTWMSKELVVDGDNVFLFDAWTNGTGFNKEGETGQRLYLRKEYATTTGHTEEMQRALAERFANRLFDVFLGRAGCGGATGGEVLPDK